MTTKNPDSGFSKKQRDTISDLVSDQFLGTKKREKKDTRADNYILNLAKKVFETPHNMERIPSSISNSITYKFDSSLIHDNEFKNLLESSPAGSCDNNSIITNKRVTLEELKQWNINTDDFEKFDNISKSTVFSFEIQKCENYYILEITEN